MMCGSQLGRVAASLGFALAIGIALAFVAAGGLTGYFIWFTTAMVVGMLTLVLGLASRGPLRTGLNWALVSYAVCLSGATIGVSVLRLRPLELAERPVLWFENYNLLGAALATSAVAALVALGQTWLRWFIVAIVAVALTVVGSRTAIAAFIVAVLADSVLRIVRTRSRQGTVQALLVVTIVGALALSRVLIGLEPPVHRNLIYPTDDLAHRNWNRRSAQGAFIERRDDLPGPLPGGVVYHLRARSGVDPYPGLILYASIGAGAPGVTYTASVYVRADIPQNMLVGNNLTEEPCNVDVIWVRCAAPAVRGNGRIEVHLQIRTLGPGDELDVYLWGPQVDVGNVPGEVEHRPTGLQAELWDSGILARADLTSVLKGDPGRAAAARVALRAFRQNPLVGVGSRYSEMLNEVAANTSGAPSDITHAHNMVLQLVAQVGLLGLAAFVIPFVAALSHLGRMAVLRVIPLIAAVFILNTWDYTFFSNGGFYAFWLTLGLNARRGAIYQATPTDTTDSESRQPEIST